MQDSREKGAGMRDQDPLPDPVLTVKPTMKIRLNIHSFASCILRLP